MARYLEYEKVTGRIISEIISETVPKANTVYDIMEIPDDLQLDTSIYAIKDGQLVKLFETNEELMQREQLRKENIERVRARISRMVMELAVAILDDNDKAIKDLQKEYKELKVYL